MAHECPSDAYYKKVQTSSGLTPAHPYNLLPNELAYGDWDRTNHSLLFDSHAAFKQYTAAKPVETWSAEETARWEVLRIELYDLDVRFEALPGPRSIFVSGLELSAHIESAVQLATDIVCLQQRIDEETEALGGKPYGAPGKPPTPAMGLFEKALTVGGLLGGGFLLIYGARSFQNRKGS